MSGTGTVVQHPSTSQSTASTSTPQTVANPTLGNVLLAWADSDGTQTTPTDNGTGGVWTLRASVVDGNGCYLWTKQVAAGDTTMTSVALGGVSARRKVGVIEIGGVTSSAYDVSGTATVITGSSGTVTNSATNTTTGADGDFVLHFAMLHSISVTTQPTAVSWTNGFTLLDNVGQLTTNSEAVMIGTLNQGTAGAIASVASWTTGWEDRQGLIISFKLAPGGVVSSPAPFLPLAIPPGIGSPMAFPFSPRHFPTVNGWPSDSDRAGIGGLTAAPVAVRFVAVNWRSSASVASTVTGARQAVAALPALGRVAAPAARAPQAASSVSARGGVADSPVRAPQPATAASGLARTGSTVRRAPQVQAAVGGRGGISSTVARAPQLVAAANAVARAVSAVVRAPQAAASAAGLARTATTPVRAPQPAAAPAGLGRTVPVMIATRAANVTAGSLARSTATLGKLLPLSAAANSFARALSTVVRAPQVATAASARARATTVPLRAPQPAAAAGGLGRDIFAPVTIRQAISSAGGRATATAFTGRVFLLASNLRAVGSTVASMLRSAQPAAAVAGIGRVTTAMTAARQALAAVGALGRTTTAPRRTATAFGSLAARGGVGGSLGRGLVTSADVTAQGRIRAVPIRSAQPAAAFYAAARIQAATTTVRQASATGAGVTRTVGFLHSSGLIVTQIAVAIRQVGHLDVNPLRVRVESTADRSGVTSGPAPTGVTFRNPVSGAHRTR